MTYMTEQAIRVTLPLKMRESKEMLLRQDLLPTECTCHAQALFAGVPNRISIFRTRQAGGLCPCGTFSWLVTLLPVGGRKASPLLWWHSRLVSASSKDPQAGRTLATCFRSSIARQASSLGPFDFFSQSASVSTYWQGRVKPDSSRLQAEFGSWSPFRMLRLQVSYE